MSKQRYQINQIVRVAQNTRYFNPRGFGIVQDYKPGTYAGYRVVMFCTQQVSDNSYRENRLRYTNDKILQCRPCELSRVGYTAWNDTVEDVKVMRSSFSKVVKEVLVAKERNTRYGTYVYQTQFDEFMNRLVWLSFSNKRLETMVTYPGSYGVAMVRSDTFFSFPLEQEINRSEYVYQ